MITISFEVDGTNQAAILAVVHKIITGICDMEELTDIEINALSHLLGITADVLHTYDFPVFADILTSYTEDNFALENMSRCLEELAAAMRRLQSMSSEERQSARIEARRDRAS